MAGHEATVHLIGNGVLHLLTHPAEADRLRGDAEAVSVAVEELLRQSGPAEIAPMRFTLEPVEIAGVVIPAGEAVQIVNATANRDARRFPDPDRLVFDRQDNAHLGFGHGIHYCLGAPWPGPRDRSRCTPCSSACRGCDWRCPPSRSPGSRASRGR
ncbi:cytochrome P450 [Nonomuraea sp. K274]|uniref:Cytochrome P450 n=2 Tax=Nonomuraea cypriaca TaxID=1187855 RepID=A0A931AAS8_9ACTN|nr:cytochrome P450 [Nonomuraea cypriaca]